MQNWKTQRPGRDDVAGLLQEAAALPCLIEEQHIIARLLAAYDRWLVLPSALCSRPMSIHLHVMLVRKQVEHVMLQAMPAFPAWHNKTQKEYNSMLSGDFQREAMDG